MRRPLVTQQAPQHSVSTPIPRTSPLATRKAVKVGGWMLLLVMAAAPACIFDQGTYQGGGRTGSGAGTAGTGSASASDSASAAPTDTTTAGEDAGTTPPKDAGTGG